MSAVSALDYLDHLQAFGIRPGLETIRALLTRLGHPEREVPSVHLAGTNGKGSTAALIASILQARAAPSSRIGLYTSPHLIEFAERIQVNGQPIGLEALAALTDEIRASLGTLKPTFFEFTTALAFLVFARAGVDPAVIETGLGGRWDATNVVQPLVTLITTVDLDHEGHLGSTLAQIATEKSGIIKPEIPLVTAADTPAALVVIEQAARANHAPLYRLGKAIRVEGESPARFTYHGLRRRLTDLTCPLLGSHQLVNCGLALCAVELLEDRGITVTEAAIRRGLRAVRCEGRLEVVRDAPLVVLDGAHNPAAAKVIASFLAAGATVRRGRIIFVVGIMRDKRVEAVVESLLPPGLPVDTVVMTRAACERAAETSRLAEALRPYPVAAIIRERVRDAVDHAMACAGPQDIVCITGSFYVVGEARAHLLGLRAPSALRG